MTTTYWISQALVVIAYILLGIGFKRKTRLEILAFSCIYQCLMIVQFILLSGTMGVIAGIIALCRNFLFLYNEKNGKGNPKWVLIVFSITAIVLTIIFYKSLADLFPLIMTLIGIYIYWNRNTKVTRIGNLLISACYIIYAITLASWFSIICELYLAISTIYGYLKHDINKMQNSTSQKQN